MNIRSSHMNTLKWAVLAGIVASPAFAHHDKTPLREAMMDGHTHEVGGATFWLAAAVIAMVLALWAVHKSVFRK